MKYLKLAMAPLLLVALAACEQDLGPQPQLEAQAVTFDAATGTGFVGKGDVQTALGFNNKQLQDAARSLSFTYEGTETVTVVCERENRRNIVTQRRERVTSVNNTVAYDPRVRNQITGFNLTGFGSTSETVSGPNPECPAADGWEEISRESESSPSALKVNGVAL